MKFTVINMGRESFALNSGDIIVTLLFFSLEPPAKKSYSERNHNIKGDVGEEQLSRLAKDFLDFERRAADAATRAEREARWWTAGVPVIGALIGVVGTIIAAFLFTASRVHDVENKIVENKASADIEISKIKEKIDDQKLEKRIEELERLMKKTQPRSPKP